LYSLGVYSVVVIFHNAPISYPVCVPSLKLKIKQPMSNMIYSIFVHVLSKNKTCILVTTVVTEERNQS